MVLGAMVTPGLLLLCVPGSVACGPVREMVEGEVAVVTAEVVGVTVALMVGEGLGEGAVDPVLVVLGARVCEGEALVGQRLVPGLDVVWAGVARDVRSGCWVVTPGAGLQGT